MADVEPCTFDSPIDYQRIRYTPVASKLRGFIYRLFIGNQGWPLSFRPPSEHQAIRTSPHLYIHLPFCHSICPHCPYNQLRYEQDKHDRYASRLQAEIEYYLTDDSMPEIESIYFGGGTPSATPDMIKMVLDLLGPKCTENVEIGDIIDSIDVHSKFLDVQLSNFLRDCSIS